MSKEVEVLSSVKWPKDISLPVALTFEMQSGEGAPRLPGDRPNFMVGGTLEYGARTGIWNILELLSDRHLTATFFVCGTTALAYPKAVRAIADAGHEIAGMSFGFDRVRTMASDRERDMVKRTVKTLEDATGQRIKGWRCPDYRVSVNTLDILCEQGFEWDSSLLNDDSPSLYQCASGTLIEIPFTTSTADKTFVGYPYPQRGGPDGLEDAWNSEFDVLHEESAGVSRYMILSLQTWAVGRPAPLRSLNHFIENVSQRNAVRFVTCRSISQWSRSA